MPEVFVSDMRNGNVKLVSIFGGINPENREEFFLDALVEYRGESVGLVLTGGKKFLDFVGLFYDGRAKDYNHEWIRNGVNVKIRDFGDVLPKEYVFVGKIRRFVVECSRRIFLEAQQTQ